MATRFNEPNYSFLIETLTAEGEHLCYWRIDQVLPRDTFIAANDALHNQVNRHLDSLSKRLGIEFGVALAGPLEQVTDSMTRYGYVVD